MNPGSHVVGMSSVAVFRSGRTAECDERVLVLTAVDIPSEVHVEGVEFVVTVPPGLLAHARHHLWHYESERRRRPLVMPLSRHFPHAWIGSAVYVVVLFFVTQKLTS